MQTVTVPRERPPVFPDACAVCGRASPGSTTRVKAVVTRRVAWVVTVFAGEWGADVPTCEGCGKQLRSQHRRRFLFALLCVVVGTVVAEVVVPEAAGWWRNQAFVAIILICAAPYLVYERLDRRPVSLAVKGSRATFTFRDPWYAAEFAQLNRIEPR